MHSLDDTIAAIATAPGAAGLAVVRISGQQALAFADRAFSSTGTLVSAATHTLHHGWAVRRVAGTGPAVVERLDEVVAAVFRAPRSYTREDVVELSCHGGRLPALRVLEALLEAGARLAAPGEFSMRAFLNGRIDLAQAEAVADVIHAETDAARALAVAQLAGDLSRRLRGLFEPLNDTLAEIEARVDFAEDVGGIEVPAHALDCLDAATIELARLVEHASYARAVRDGARVPIVGRPNAGKSSLFNALLGEQRALVTELPGTTRDRVSESVEIDGVRVVLSDTAGIRDSPERIEALGIALSETVLAECPVAIWVVDASQPLGAADERIAGLLVGKRVVVALNKSDLPARVSDAQLSELLGRCAVAKGSAACGSAVASSAAQARWAVRVPCSAARGEGLRELRAAILEVLGGFAASGLTLAVSNPRHVDALRRARLALERASLRGREGAPGEIVAIELREGLAAIGEVTGAGVDPELLDRIFSRFCVGK